MAVRKQAGHHAKKWPTSKVQKQAPQKARGRGQPGPGRSLGTTVVDGIIPEV
jgi:hypothetical protein